MNDGLILYIPGVVLLTALLIKLPTLRRTWHDPLMRSVCALLLVGCAVLFLAAPPTIAAVNDLTGVVNFSAPLVYSVLTAFSGSCIVLIINWRGGRPDQIRRSTVLCLGAYGVVTLAIVVLFVLADAPVERLRDLDTYYATTPFMREMITLYLVAHASGSVVLTTLCWRWLRQVDGSLRTGLALIVLGGALDVGYLAAKFAAVLARWTHRDWDYLSTYVAPPLASAAALMCGVGFILPLVGDRATSTWRAYLQYRRLKPLWLELQGSATPWAATMTIAWWSSVELRRCHREAAIHDGLLNLAPYLSSGVREHALATATSRGVPPERAGLVAEAAMIASACSAHTAASRSTAPLPDPRSDAPRLEYADASDGLVALSRTLSRSSIVAAARRSAALPETARQV
ncbi:MAB_1171c family putative transporter [Streptomyces sp. NPDC019890]|uniref:MAB_1171c family putative transporter n=1 Tax=Streptomyces sp. NPDC019890 TaxID=3365064 RepID=UPI00384AD616